ncbi:hypothetical protein [Paenibacillus sp. TH7-28]
MEGTETAEVAEGVEGAETAKATEAAEVAEDSAIAVKKGVIFGEKGRWDKIKEFFTAILGKRRGKGDFPRLVVK